MSLVLGTEPPASGEFRSSFNFQNYYPVLIFGPNFSGAGYCRRRVILLSQLICAELIMQGKYVSHYVDRLCWLYKYTPINPMAILILGKFQYYPPKAFWN